MVRQVGALSETRVDIRIIAATNRGLKKEVIDRKFREDLYYRISEFPISLPPLRERGSEDLVNFLRRLMKTISRDTMSLSDRAIRLLCAQDWPGNIREVNNILSRAFLLNGATVINEDTIRKILEEENFCMASGDILNRPIDESFNLPEIINEVSRHYISKAMNLTNNNKSETARRLGLKNHQNLTNLMKKAGYGKNDISPITYSGNMIFNKSQVAAHTSNPVSRASCKTNKRRDCFPPRFARGRNDERDKHRLCEECNRRSNLWF
jgi:transcriptional regulator with GAF, ATPase, and Fis domain